ncbi:formate/nitrite transporter family protein [Salinicola rhizosphaerae]|uniref:Formate/nitrite transporter n=1 Tax=Salinicola rhizosphaerae TaxID=1443141 RepID=A0ABQ3EBI6_9GAMM|nr:formate/nitrite transporter family protein [Salinicola rhizosphaerae]GHB32436.1 formate/nitrite transporter [Salinicola rhizosphaerae]
MSFNSPQETALQAVSAGFKKTQIPLIPLLVLGFLAGAFIAIGFLLDIRVTGTMPAEWGGLRTFIGASVFPIGLVLTLIAGGELLTGNMMTLPMALFSRQIGVAALVRNWVLITVANFVGSVAVAYFFGHYLGLTEGDFLATTVSVAQHKVAADFGHAFVSAIGCNWLVCLAVWLGYASKDVAGKIFGIWFPVMAFVAIGFQHVVANMFVVPAAIFAGAVTWGEYLPNFIAVFLGNAVGGALFVGLAYHLAYRPAAATAAVAQAKASQGEASVAASESRAAETA